MSGDEVVVLIGSAGFATIMWWRWYRAPSKIQRLGRPATGGLALLLSPVAAGLLLFGVLQFASASDVRDDPRYLTLYFFLGAVWIRAAVACVSLAGISPRHDTLEGANRSAAYATAGALLAATLCFAGGNIGDGPGWWVVVFSAGLATGALFLTWVVLERLTRVADVVTIERDDAAGVRLAGFLLACGLILGRAVAGDWVSAAATWNDFVIVARPVLLVFAAAVVMERFAHPTPDRPSPSVAIYGVLPALLYLGLAVLYVADLGLPV